MDKRQQIKRQSSEKQSNEYKTDQKIKNKTVKNKWRKANSYSSGCAKIHYHLSSKLDPYLHVQQPSATATELPASVSFPRMQRESHWASSNSFRDDEINGLLL